MQLDEPLGRVLQPLAEEAQAELPAGRSLADCPVPRFMTTYSEAPTVSDLLGVPAVHGPAEALHVGDLDAQHPAQRLQALPVAGGTIPTPRLDGLGEVLPHLPPNRHRHEAIGTTGKRLEVVLRSTTPIRHQGDPMLREPDEQVEIRQRCDP